MTSDDAPALPVRGRPPKTKAERRSRQVTTRWSAEELELLEYRAEVAELPVAVFVRLSALGTLND